MRIPWQALPAAFIIIAIVVVIWNSMKMRRRLGDKPTREDIQASYTRAKTFTVGRGKLED